MNLRLLRYGAPVVVLLVGAACGVEVISDDDGEGGDDCGAGGAPTTNVVATTGVGSTYATGLYTNTASGGWSTTVSVQGSTASGVTTGGSCPDDPGFQGCGSSSATTGTSGGSACGVHYCDPNGGPALFQRECSPETMACTCSAPQGSCVCAWNGNCEEPCCGNPPDDPWG